ncbi:MAG: hypothetical protein C0487_08775 [Leptothrix sp. (in: Bacteria)]|nr:hypothetical protein [Leptothrix sp. (in: b-proteobacteria)]
MNNTSKHIIRPAAWAVHAALWVATGSASAANSQTVCSPTVPGYADCSLSLGNVVFNAQGVNLAPSTRVFVDSYDGGMLNLPQADVVQVANGQGVAFDPGYSQSVGYSGSSEGLYWRHGVANLDVLAAPGFTLNSVSIRFEGVATIVGAANLKFYGQLQRPDLTFNEPGAYAFDLTFTSSATDLATGHPPTLAWEGYATNGQYPNNGPSVTGLFQVALTKMTVSASVSPVPESATLALMALGLVGIGLARARHARA